MRRDLRWSRLWRGVIFYKDERVKRKGFEKKVEERKSMEKRDKWIKELEARDREDQEWEGED